MSQPAVAQRTSSQLSRKSAVVKKTLDGEPPVALPLLVPGGLMDGDVPRPFLTTRPRPPVKWTEEDDRLLRAAVEKHGDKKWKEISWEVPNRNHVQCLQRWNKVLKPGLKKGCWSDEEDIKLKALVNQAGDNVINWGLLATQIEGRTPKQCRERWQCNLDPLIDRGPFTPNEDSVVLEMQSQFGNRWSLIAQSLPGRTENAIKTRFRSIQRVHRKRWSGEEDRIAERVESGAISMQEALAQMPNRDAAQVNDRIKVLANSRAHNQLRSSRTSRSESSSTPGAATNGAQLHNSAPSPTTFMQQQQQLPFQEFTQSQFLERNKLTGASPTTMGAPPVPFFTTPGHPSHPQGLDQHMANFSGSSFLMHGMPMPMGTPSGLILPDGNGASFQQNKSHLTARRNTTEEYMNNLTGGGNLDVVDLPGLFSHQMGNRRELISGGPSPRPIKRAKTETV